MSKGLEALVSLELNACQTSDQKEWAYNIIEKELKALEIISKGFNMWVEEIKDYKGNPIYRLVLCYNLSDRFYLNITKEKYELLKEVLNEH